MQVCQASVTDEAKLLEETQRLCNPENWWQAADKMRKLMFKFIRPTTSSWVYSITNTSIFSLELAISPYLLRCYHFLGYLTQMKNHQMTFLVIELNSWWRHTCITALDTEWLIQVSFVAKYMYVYTTCWGYVQFLIMHLFQTNFSLNSYE